MGQKRPPTFSVDGLADSMGVSDFAAGTVCWKQIIPSAKSAGIAAKAAQGAQLLVRNEVTQNSPGFQVARLSAPQSAPTRRAPV